MLLTRVTSGSRALTTSRAGGWNVTLMLTKHLVKPPAANRIGNDATMNGDILLVNGRIITMNPAQPEARAVAIRNGRIVVVGDDVDAKAAAAPGCETVDLKGHTAT